MQAGSSLPSFWMRNKLPKEYNKQGIKNNEGLKWSLLSCSWWITFSLHLGLGWEYPGASLTLPMTKRLQGLASTPCPVQWRISLKNPTAKRKSRSYLSFKICVGRVWGRHQLANIFAKPLRPCLEGFVWLAQSANLCTDACCSSTKDLCLSYMLSIPERIPLQQRTDFFTLGHLCQRLMALRNGDLL